MTTTPTRTTSGTLLTAEGITKSYGARTAVDHVDLALGRGIVGVLGPNGAGKTTLLRMLATVLAPDQGTLSLLGLDPASSAARTEVRRRLGYLPQSPRLYGGFTPLEMVDYVAILKEHTDTARRRREAAAILEAVGLGDRMHKRIPTSSSSTNRPPASTRSSASPYGPSWPRRPSGAASCCRRTTPPRWPPCANRSSSWTAAGSAGRAPRPTWPGRPKAGCGSPTSRSPLPCARG